jgi:hypothetical protein
VFESRPPFTAAKTAEMLVNRPGTTALLLAAAVLAACSVKRTAVDIVGDAVSGGSGVYASDDDPDLVREAIPFGLKTYESLLAVSPEHRGLLLAAANGFVRYAYLLEQEADEIEAADPAGARALRARPSVVEEREHEARRGREDVRLARAGDDVPVCRDPARNAPP